MVTGLIQSLLPAVLLTSSIATPALPQASIANSESSPLLGASYSALLTPSSFYVVKPGDTLRSIAKLVYNDENYWTTLWNDNDWIDDPNTIESGWKLKITQNRPPKVEKLKEELVQKSFSQVTSVVKTISRENVDTSPQSVQPVNSSPSVAGPLNEEQLTFLGNCESGMTANRNSGNGYYGAFQFSSGTWSNMETGYARADLAPLEIQKDAVNRLVSRSSIFTQFPGCSARMRAAGII